MMTSLISMGVGAAAAHYLKNGMGSKRDWKKMQKRMRRMFS
ncbi:YrzQ family protein [Metabacillus sp. RGM 3146]